MPSSVDPRSIDEIAAETALLAAVIEAGTNRLAPGATASDAAFARRVILAIGRAPFTARDLYGLENVVGIVRRAAAAEVIGERLLPSDACDSTGEPLGWIRRPVHSPRGEALLDLADRMQRYLELRDQLTARRAAEGFLLGT